MNKIMGKSEPINWVELIEGCNKPRQYAVYFRVNDGKLYNHTDKLLNRIEKVLPFILKRKHNNYGDIDIINMRMDIGLTGDDFAVEKHTICIRYNIKITKL